MTPFWDKRMADWVAQRIPDCELGFGACQAMGVLHRDKIIAGVVFNNWQPSAGVMEISVAAESPKWFCRSVLNAGFGYAFDDAGCQMVIARHRADNARARKPWLAIGAKETVIPRLYGRDTAGVIATLTKEQWQNSKFYRRNADGEARRARTA